MTAACPTSHHHARLDRALLRGIATLDTRVPITLHFEKKPGCLLIHSASKTSSQKLGLLGSRLLQNAVGVQATEAMQGDLKA